MPPYPTRPTARAPFPFAAYSGRALLAAQDLRKELQQRRLVLLLSACKGRAHDVLERSGFLEQVGAQNVFSFLPEAVQYGLRLHAHRVGPDGMDGAGPRSLPGSHSEPSLSSLGDRWLRDSTVPSPAARELL